MGFLARLIFGFVIRKPVTTAAVGLAVSNAPAITKKVKEVAKLPATAGAALDSAAAAAQQAGTGAAVVGAVYFAGRLAKVWK